MDSNLKVLYKIKELNDSKTPATFTVLCKELPDIKKDVGQAIEALSDWGLIYGEYGDIGNNRAGRMYFLDELAILQINANQEIKEGEHE